MSTLPLANGLVVDKETGRVFNPSLPAEPIKRLAARNRPANTDGRDRINTAIRIGIAELPADHKAVKTVGMVWLFYTLGLSDYDIVLATGLTIEQVENIKGMALFDTLQTRIMQNVGKLGDEDLSARIARLAPRAVDELESVLEDSDVEANTRISVAKDLLDRAGFAPKQVIESRSTKDVGITIRYVDDAKTIDVPVVDVVQEEAEDA